MYVYVYIRHNSMLLSISDVLTSLMTPIRPLFLSRNMATLLVIPSGAQDNENGHKIWFHHSYVNHQTPKQLQFSIFFYNSLISNKIIKPGNNCQLTVWLQDLLYCHSMSPIIYFAGPTVRAWNEVFLDNQPKGNKSSYCTISETVLSPLFMARVMTHPHIRWHTHTIPHTTFSTSTAT